jgi:translation elongation factor EF-1alpha
MINPPAKVGEVKSIEMHHEEIPEAIPGDNIGWNVRGISGNEIRRGDVCGHVDNPPTVADEFTAQIVVLHSIPVQLQWVIPRLSIATLLKLLPPFAVLFSCIQLNKPELNLPEVSRNMLLVHRS